MFVVDFILFRMWCFLFLFLIFLTWKAKTVAQDAWEFFGSQFGLETWNWRESFLKYSRTWRMEKTTRNIVDFRCWLSWPVIFLSLKFAEEKASCGGTIEWELSVLHRMFSVKKRGFCGRWAPATKRPHGRGMRFVVHVLSQTEKEEHILLGCLVSINEKQINKERIHKESHQRKHTLFETTTTITTTTAMTTRKTFGARYKAWNCSTKLISVMVA